MHLYYHFNEKSLLKFLLASYILMALILAGLNFGYARQAPAHIAEIITWWWHFYENWIKTAYIILGSILTLRLIGGPSKSKMRKNNLKGFILMALLIHILGPFLFRNSDLYFFAMPLPWTTIPLQLLEPLSTFYQNFTSLHGIGMISTTLLFYLALSLLIFIGTLLKGRRWQCSTLCLFNGFVSEVFAPALPLLGRSKKLKPPSLKFFALLRWFFFALSLAFVGYWLLILYRQIPTLSLSLVYQMEIYKYLLFELLAAMAFWVILSGRAYCHYCPLGTLLALLSRLASQRIRTDLHRCIQCGKCDLACPMSIAILEKAKLAKPVQDLNCVACGHCVDICPTQTLGYTTW